MPDPFPTAAARTRAVVALLAKEGALSAVDIAVALDSTRVAIVRVLRAPLFEPTKPGSRGRYRLTDAGRRLAAELG